MRALLLPPELTACVSWLRAIRAQSWRAPAPPPWPPRPTVNPEAQAFWDYLGPIYAQTTTVWGQLASFRAPTAAPYDVTAEQINAASAP